MLTARQAEVLDFIAAEIDKTGVCPSYQEIASALGMASKSNVYRMVVSLEERGYVRRLARQARAVEVVKPKVAPAIGAVTEDFQRGYDAGFEAGVKKGREG